MDSKNKRSAFLISINKLSKFKLPKSQGVRQKPSSQLWQKLIVVLSKDQLKGRTLKNFDAEVNERIQARLSQLLDPLEEGSSAVCHGSTEIIVALLPKDLSSFSVLTWAGKLIRGIVGTSLETLAIVQLQTSHEKIINDALVSALEVARHAMPLYGTKAKERKTLKLKNVDMFSSRPDEKALQESRQITWGTNLVRDLGTVPPNLLTAANYCKQIEALCKQESLGVKFYSNRELKKMGAGAFTAVDQANPESQGGIFELTYMPSKPRSNEVIALVGKGLCFDTGGYDVKTNGYMISMKGDMTGSAVALATLIVLSRMKFPYRLKAYLGVTENHISPRAYKPDDVVTALNGLAIEVINTDAEGRMVLADTLCLASRSKPKLMIDYATLTGAAVIAIGNQYSAAVSNRSEWTQKIIDAGKRSGERVWPFPLENDWAKSLESKIADLLQCVKSRSPDHLIAAYFLSRFVGEGIDWIHVDLAAADREGGLAHVDSTFTGFGVRWTVDFLKNHLKV